MDIYREEILAHWQNPQNFGVMDVPDVVVEQVNPLCGDEVTFYVKLGGSKPSYSSNRRREVSSLSSRYVRTIINDVRFTGSGCAISIASASMLSEAIKGKSLSVINKITGQDMLKLIGGPIAPARLKCAFLALEAVKKLASS